MSMNDTTPPKQGTGHSTNQWRLPQEFLRDTISGAWELVLDWINRSTVKSVWATACLSTLSLLYLGAGHWLTEVPELLRNIGGWFRDFVLVLNSLTSWSEELWYDPTYVWPPQSTTLTLIVLACWSFVLLGTYIVCRSADLPPQDSSDHKGVAGIVHRVVVIVWSIVIWVVFDPYKPFELDFLTRFWELLGNAKATFDKLIHLLDPIVLLAGWLGTHMWRPVAAKVNGATHSTNGQSVSGLRQFVTGFIFAIVVLSVVTVATGIVVASFLSKNWSLDLPQTKSLSMSLQSLLWYLVVAGVYLAATWKGLRQRLEVGAKLLVLTFLAVGLLQLSGEYFRDIIFPSQPDDCIKLELSSCPTETCDPTGLGLLEILGLADCPDRYHYVYSFQAAAIIYLARQFTRVAAWIVRVDRDIRLIAKRRQERAEEEKAAINNSLKEVNLALHRVPFLASIYRHLRGTDSPFEY